MQTGSKSACTFESTFFKRMGTQFSEQFGLFSMGAGNVYSPSDVPPSLLKEHKAFLTNKKKAALES